jgi:acyl-homoserine lactone acylase PvdQ
MLAGMPRPSSSEEATFQTERVALLVKKTSSRQQLSYLLEALQSLNARFGTWKTAWGEINRYQRSSDGVFRDDQPSLPVAQTASTFGQLPSFVSAAQNTKKRYGYSGNSFIAAVEFGPRLKAKSIITGGQSFDPASKHFTDQANMYLEGRFKDVLFYKEDVLKHVEKKYHPGE